MTLREEFEAWLLEVHGLDSVWQEERNCFADFPAHLAFQAWQASRAALVIELIEPQSCVSPDGWDEFDAAKAAIKAAGVTVKVRP